MDQSLGLSYLEQHFAEMRAVGRGAVHLRLGFSTPLDLVLVYSWQILLAFELGRHVSCVARAVYLVLLSTV